MNFSIEEIERDPKTFFVNRLREQARMEGSAFFPEEEEYLELARTGKDEEAQGILKKIKKQKKFDEVDEHLSGLMNRAYDMDISCSPEGREVYRRAVKALANVDTWPHLSMFVSQIVFDERFEEGRPSRLPLREVVLPWLITAAVLALGWWIGTHWRR